MTIQERLNSKTYAQDGHLMWGGPLNMWGYGGMKVEGKLKATHRIAWEIAYGPIPEGKQVNHTCDTPPCLLPWHLYLGTQGDNVDDMVRAGNHLEARKTSCPQGHHYNEENTAHYSGARVCRICRSAIRQRRRLALCR